MFAAGRAGSTIMGVLAFLFRRDPRRAAIDAAYRRIVERSRQPSFYTGWGVPDTLDGRFELLELHAFLVLHRLRGEGEAAAAFAQALFDTLFADMDRGLREMGAGDLGVGRHVKDMAKAFYGRITAYEKGLVDEAALAAGLRRNLFGTVEPGAPQLALAAGYLKRQAAALQAQPLARLLAGEVDFAPLVGD
jgi:cytochrome b pre-mRNA-processing protein 3